MSVKNYKDFTVGILVLIALAVISALPMALLSLVAFALSAAIIGYMTTRFPLGYLLLGLFSYFVIYYLTAGNLLSATVTVLPVVLCGISFGIGYNVRLSPMKMIAIGTSVVSLCIVANLKLLTELSGENIFLTTMETVKNVYESLFSEVASTAITQDELKSYVSEIITTLVRFFPSFIIIACFIYAIFVYYTFKRLCMMRKVDLQGLESFSEWRAEKSIAVIYFAVVAISFVFSKQSLVADVVLNIDMIMTFVFFVYGLSLLEHIFKKVIQKSGIRKMLITFIAFISLFTGGLFFLVLSIAGAMDAFLDYRHRKTSH